ncbi:hypothetical protein CL617_04010 [archaeon]|nr:hypothetical protein [archaeon]|tara:strand:+ start:138 stop:1397 length:1260 start_codon:yes stop_codon:yes gene_type:complete
MKITAIQELLHFLKNINVHLAQIKDHIERDNLEDKDNLLHYVENTESNLISLVEHVQKDDHDKNQLDSYFKTFKASLIDLMNKKDLQNRSIFYFENENDREGLIEMMNELEKKIESSTVDMDNVNKVINSIEKELTQKSKEHSEEYSLNMLDTIYRVVESLNLDDNPNMDEHEKRFWQHYLFSVYPRALIIWSDHNDIGISKNEKKASRIFLNDVIVFIHDETNYNFQNKLIPVNSNYKIGNSQTKEQFSILLMDSEKIEQIRNDVIEYASKVVDIKGLYQLWEQSRLLIGFEEKLQIQQNCIGIIYNDYQSRIVNNSLVRERYPEKHIWSLTHHIAGYGHSSCLNLYSLTNDSGRGENFEDLIMKGIFTEALQSIKDIIPEATSILNREDVDPFWPTKDLCLSKEEFEIYKRIIKNLE